MQQKRSLKLFVLALLLFLAACSGEKWVSYSSETLGILVEIPEAWLTKEASDVITLAATENALEAAGIAESAGVSITPVTSSDFNGVNDPGEVLGYFREFFEYGQSDLDVIVEAHELIINDQKTASITYSGTVREQKGVFVATIISSGDNMALVLTVDSSPDESFGETLERITHSIKITK